MDIIVHYSIDFICRYGIEKHRPRGEGAKYYPDDCRAGVVAASNKVYFAEDLFELCVNQGESLAGYEILTSVTF